MRKVFVFALLVVISISMLAHAEAMGEIVLYEGTDSITGIWKLITSVLTSCAGGEFDPALIQDGSYFTVDFVGTPGQVYLSLSDWTGKSWSQVNAPERCVTEGEIHTATFTYAQCLKAYGDEDFSDVDVIGIGSANAEGDTKVLRIVWHGETPIDPLRGSNAVMISRSAMQSDVANGMLTALFTKHVGGEFDAAQINEGSRFFVEYAGPKDGVYLAFASHSGPLGWARIDPDETIDLGKGRMGAWFDCASISRAWGTNFARLDQINVLAAVDGPVKFYRFAYLPGEGVAVDPSDGRWDRPDTGIAFIGDSICQYTLHGFGDWNTILGRKDCVNYGIGGQTTAHCLARIDELAGKNYHTVVFLCGINDIGQGYTKEEIVANYAAMVEAIRAKNPACQFILLSVLPTTDAYYRGYQDRIVMLNKAYQAFAKKTEGVTFVDTYSHFTSAPYEYAYPELLMDGLHPNAAGYQVIAEVLSSALPAE